MTRLLPCASLLFLLSACATAVKVSSGPGTTPQTRLHRVNDLAFEAPAAFSTQRVGLIDFMDGLPGPASAGGVTLTFCGAPEIQSCGALGVRLRDELTAAQCTDPEHVRGWLGLERGASLRPASHPQRPGWLAENAAGAHRLLLLCDGDHSWLVKAIAPEEKGVAPASFAFDMFLRTARFEAIRQGG